MPYPTLTYYPVEHLSNGQMIFHDNHEFRGIGDTKCGIHTEWCKSCATDEMVDCPFCYPPESPFGTLDYGTEYHKLRAGLRATDYYLRVKRNPAGKADNRAHIVPSKALITYYDKLIP